MGIMDWNVTSKKIAYAISMIYSTFLKYKIQIAIRKSFIIHKKVIPFYLALGFAIMEIEDGITFQTTPS